MRIGMFTDTFPPEINGVSNSCFTIYNALKKQGHQVYVFTTNPFGNQLTVEGDLIRIPGKTLKTMYQYRFISFLQPKVLRIAKSLKLDVIHVQSEFSVGFVGMRMAKKLGVPMVDTFHTMTEEYTYYFTHGRIDRIARHFVRGWTKNIINNAKQFITPSMKTKAYIRGIMSLDRYVNVVPTGFDFYRFRPENQDPQRLKEFQDKYDLHDCYTVLFLGRVGKEKSIDVCIDGFHKFTENNPNLKTKFFIIGSGPTLADLEEQATKLGLADKVIFLGAVPLGDVGFYYNVGDVFVCASVTETQGLTYMEAMASEISMLVRYDDTLTDLIKEGYNGFFFSNIDEMAIKLKKIYDCDHEELEKLTTNAFCSLDRYSLEGFYNRTYMVYKRAVRSGW